MVIINSAKWCVVHLTGIVQSCRNPLFTYIYLPISLYIIQGLVIAQKAQYHLSQSDRCGPLLISYIITFSILYDTKHLKNVLLVISYPCKLLFQVAKCISNKDVLRPGEDRHIGMFPIIVPQPVYNCIYKLFLL
jgi:hypothetical protein